MTTATGRPRACEDEPTPGLMSRTDRAETAFDALARALDDAAPGCKGDTRFTLDAHQLQRDEVTFLSVKVCRPCPLRALCQDYAEAAKPQAGVWAGRVYGPRRGRPDD
ncbi:WhiB family transcriptional regulator [Microbacterium sp. SA39]|uniref:WhiB family transcriptional regulator n=1 Tax=Microbacterium sp. SA39 TaxID=1263625 RepID=UPI0005FA76FA|nr:WhiB family transcriptional regulator [Microbacterium sp. SA39]KJQ54153.1 hypothetical protein RS85_02224 [Microbacterium sp. SA39]